MSNKNRMVPALRFPDFRDAGAWEENKLGDFSLIVRGGSPRPIEGFLTSGADGLNWLKIGDVDKNSKYVTHTQEKVRVAALSKTREVNLGDLIISNSMSFGRPYILKIKSCIHDGWIAITKIDNQVDRDYLYYLILSPSSQEFFNDNAAGSGVQNLNADIIKSLPILAPSLPEQQKIAACLSSLDDLITAHTQKLDALKAHKKGLMQQLFPAEGETTPNLRFPEFRNAGAWEEKRLGEICKYWNGLSHEKSITENGGYYLISLNSIDIDGNLKANMKRLSFTDNSLQKNDLIMVLSDVAHGNFLGLTDIIPNDRFVLNQRMAGLRLRESDQVSGKFVRTTVNFNQKYFKQKGQGSSQLNLSKSSVTDFPVFLPSPPEQQKIAACLTSLDDLITAHTQKLDALKIHKKGLMQQIFPINDEVNG